MYPLFIVDVFGSKVKNKHTNCLNIQQTNKTKGVNHLFSPINDVFSSDVLQIQWASFDHMAKWYNAFHQKHEYVEQGLYYQ